MSCFAIARVAALAGIALAVASCTTAETVGYPDVLSSSFGETVHGLQTEPPVRFHADDEYLTVGKAQFRDGNYGNAQQYFQKAVEVTPNDAEAWLGLAASYDHIRRFDLADRAYKQARRYIGHTPQYLNNYGYSQLLRGRLVPARQYFLKAYELDPDNPTIVNNLKLLRNSVHRPSRG